MRAALEPAVGIADRAPAFAWGGRKRLIHETNIARCSEQIKNRRSRQCLGLVISRGNGERKFQPRPVLDTVGWMTISRKRSKNNEFNALGQTEDGPPERL
jgi:hypothetical protein